MSTETTTRRDFLRATGAAALASVTARSTLHPRSAHADPPQISPAIPPHRAIPLPGIHAYPHRHSVEAGESIQFHVSSTQPYGLDIFKLGPAVDDPSKDRLVHSLGSSQAFSQPIHPGSYVHVENGLRTACPALTLECWIRPWDTQHRQGILTQHQGNDASGFALLLLPGGAVGFQVGLHSHAVPVVRQTPAGIVSKGVWHHLVAVWDGHTQQIWVNGALAAQWEHSGVFQPGTAPIRLGASASEEGHAQFFFDGDLAAPVLYSTALAAAEVQHRRSLLGLAENAPPGSLGFWPFSEETGENAADRSGQNRHGRIINLGTWMIGGPSFDATRVGRYDTTYDPGKDPARGHAIRLASDDLYDCRWRPTHTWAVPADAAPGLYVARFRPASGGTEKGNDLVFLVRRAKSSPKAPLLLLCSTSTWIAYNSAPFCAPIPPGTLVGTGGHRNSHPEAPAYSCYRNHRAGQPAYQFGLRMPWPVAGPAVHYSPPGTGYSHLMRGERFLQVWLEESGYAFDVASDLDLHQNPSLLQGYQAVLINGHSEYWSAEAYDTLDRYLTGGGNAAVFSGNTMFWRTSFSKDGTVMECRKMDESIGGRQNHRIGELYHSHDQKRGSLLRECGRPAWALIGLETLGWGGTKSEQFGIYEVDEPGHFLFHTPEAVGLAKGDSFGHSADRTSVRAVGHEWDVRLSRLRAMTTAVPAGAMLPEEPAGITTLALGRHGSGTARDYFTRPAPSKGNVLAEMIYWERPQGGRVFHTGAIGSGWALSADPKFQTLIRNVLHHFGVPFQKRL